MVCRTPTPTATHWATNRFAWLIPASALQGRYDHAHDRSFKLRQVINDCRTWAKSDRAEAAHTSLSHKEQELRERAERREAKAAECEKELAEVLKLLAGLEKQMQAVRDAMLEP